MDLARATPHSELASSGYCLAAPGTEYLAYLPEGGEVSVDLSDLRGRFRAEWFSPATGDVTMKLFIEGGDVRALETPFTGDAVLYLHLDEGKAN